MVTDDKRELSLDECVRQQVELEKTMQERFTRHYAYLSVDVVESTKLKMGVAEADLLYTFGEYHSFVARVTANCSGKVISTSGDGIMAEFASEQAGINAAIEILDGLPEFNRARNCLGKPLVLRLGLNAGKVLVDDKNRDNKIFSTAIDIAGHLQKLGKPGQLLISDVVYAKAENQDDFAEYPGNFPVRVYKYKHSLDTAESQAVKLEVRLVIDPIKGKPVAELKAGDRIFVYFANRNESNRKYLEVLGVGGGRNQSLEANVVSVKRNEAGAYRIEVQFRPDLFGVDSVGTNQRIRHVRPDADVPAAPAGFWEKMMAFFRSLLGSGGK